MKTRIWVRKFNSLQEVGCSSLSDYSAMTAAQRLSVVQFLREEYWKFNRVRRHENRKRLSRVFKIIK